MSKIYFFSIAVGSMVAAAMMTYISMINPIGPWVEPVVALMTVGVASLFNFSQKEFAGSVTAGASVGGIIGTALGFSFPTFYFLDKSSFTSLVSSPLYFCLLLTGVLLIASLFGFFLALIWEKDLLDEQKLSFPIGDLAYGLIGAQSKVKQSKDMLVSFVSTTLFCLLQDGLCVMWRVIPKSVTFVKSFNIGLVQIPALRFDLYPLFWAIGFVAGPMVFLPLMVGALLKVFCLDPVHTIFYAGLKYEEFQIACCSGIVGVGAVFGILNWLFSNFKNFRSKNKYQFCNLSSFFLNHVKKLIIPVSLVMFGLNQLGFSIVSSIYLLVFTAGCVYQVLYIAGKLGLAQLGRFATFVMLPALFLFKLSFLQITIIATFVEVAAGTAVDILFGRKLSRLADLDHKKIFWYQLVGIFFSCIAAAGVFWLLVNYLELGSPDLIAQRAQTRYWLVSIKSFDPVLLILGAGLGALLKILKLNPMLVLGGILMPFNISLGLAIGGLGSCIVDDPNKYQPFVSGIFVGQTLSLIIVSLVSVLR